MASMDVAVVDGQRLPPAPGLKGVCERCGGPAQAKCGPIVGWHWAHAGRRHCDPWMENEGPWHKAWKEIFPFQWRENVRCDEATGEKHVADIRRPDDLVIELQNSPMPLDEMQSREQFYGERMLWIVNAEKFGANIRFSEALPDPRHPDVRDFTLMIPAFSDYHLTRPAILDGGNLGYFLTSDLAENCKPGALHLMYHGEQFKRAVSQSHSGQFAWGWRRPREVWLRCQRQVIFDFGPRGLWAITPYGARGDVCMQRVSRDRFVESLLSGAPPDLNGKIEPYWAWMSHG